MKPFIAVSEMTGRFYIVTRTRKDGSAQIKYDCTDQIRDIVKTVMAQTEEAIKEGENPQVSF